MARLLIAVDDPLDRRQAKRKAPPLLLGEYVQVKIQGRVLDNVFTIPRTALRDANTIWLVTEDDRLEIRQVVPVWRDAQSVVLHDDLQAGDRLIVTDLPAPVNGMEVRIQSDPSTATSSSDRGVKPLNRGDSDG
jgi:hypothetical protein